MEHSLVGDVRAERVPLLSRPNFLALLLLIFLLSGCSSTPQEKVSAVRGRLTNAGAPLEVAGKEAGVGRIEINFHALGADGIAGEAFESASPDDQGHYKMRGRDGRGIKPGKYRIAIRQWDPYPDNDKLGGKFSFENSKIVREVGETETTIDLDVSKPEG
jgi:hypothetical protein